MDSLKYFARITACVFAALLLTVGCRPPEQRNPCDPASQEFLLQGLLTGGAPCLRMDDSASGQGGFIFGPVSGNTNESGMAAQFTIQLSSLPTGNVSLTYQSADTSEGVTGNTSVVFSPENWNVPQTISVTGQDDGLQDGNQLYSVEFDPAVSSDPAYAGRTPAAVKLTNNDNEAAIFRIFVTNSTTDGSLGGIAGADSICNGDVNKPTADNYKALIVDGVARRASASANAGDGQIDWVLQPSVTYFRPDNSTAILTTNANGILVFGALTASFGSGGSQFWTGLNNDWTESGNDCGSWSTIVALSGQVGLESATGATAITNGTQLCNFNSARLVCVQQ